MLLILIPAASFASSGFIVRSGTFFIISGVIYDDFGQEPSTVLAGSSTKLYAHWTSSSDLGYAFLSTNETGLWKNHTDGTYGSPINLTGNSFWSNFTWSNASISDGGVSWVIYANDSSGNKNVTGALTFSVINYTTTTTTTTTTTFTGTGGGGRPAFVPPQDLEAKRDFTVGPDAVKVVIKQGETQEKYIEVRNTGEEELEIRIRIERMGDFILSGEGTIKLKPGETKSVKLLFTASENELPDVYLGKIVFTAGGIEKTAMMIMEVKEKAPLFDIKVEIFQQDKRFRPGEYVAIRIETINMGDSALSDVTFTYSIKDTDNNIIDEREETVAVEEIKAVVREIRIPPDLKPGKYIVYGKLSYNERIATSSDLFEVVEEENEIFYTISLLAAIILLALLIRTVLVKYHPAG